MSQSWKNILHDSEMEIKAMEKRVTELEVKRRTAANNVADAHADAARSDMRLWWFCMLALIPSSLLPGILNMLYGSVPLALVWYILSLINLSTSFVILRTARSHRECSDTWRKVGEL